MPIFVHVVKGGEVVFVDFFSTIYFKKHYLKLLEFIEKEYQRYFPTLKIILEYDTPTNPDTIVEEALRFLDFIIERDHELPRAFFFAVFPKDYTDVVSLLLGGASSIKIPQEDGETEIRGGFGEAILIKGEKFIRRLRDGEELTISDIKLKVFSKSCYEAINRPLKTLITAGLIAQRKKGSILLTEKIQEYIFKRLPSPFKAF
ncbi:MAG: hypothetical protein J7L38_02650 [Thermoproteales archaeon]|nr:hypothetical protein [Thermoproteales archaeon]